MTDLLIVHATIITMDPARRVLEDAAVLVRDGAIAAVGPSRTLLPQAGGADIIDAAGQVLMPGLIDAHGHSGHGFTRTIGAGRPGLWEKACDAIYAHASTPDFWRLDGMLLALERLKLGVTTGVTFLGGGGGILTGDMAMRTDDPIYADAHLQSIATLGTREILAVGPRQQPEPQRYSYPDREGCPTRAIDFATHMSVCEAIVAGWHGAREGRIRIALMSQMMHPAVLRADPAFEALMLDQSRAVRACARERGLLFMQDGHTRGTILYAHEEANLLGPDSLFSHSTNLTAEEIALCAETGTVIVHNPSAIASILGRCPAPELIEAGARVVLGSDGPGPDRSCDMFRHMFQAMRYHRRHFQDPAILPEGKTLEMCTIDAAHALGLGDEIGSIEPGKRADLILIDTHVPHLSPLIMPVHQVVHFASGADVSTVIVDGHVVMRDRKVRTIDEAGILEAVGDMSREIMKRTGLDRQVAPVDGFWGHSRLPV